MTERSFSENARELVSELKTMLSGGAKAHSDAVYIHNLVDDVILREGEISYALFEIVKPIFCNRFLSNLKEMDSVVREFYFKFETLDDKTRACLLEAIIANFGTYSNEDFCLTNSRSRIDGLSQLKLTPPKESGGF